MSNSNAKKVCEYPPDGLMRLGSLVKAIREDRGLSQDSFIKKTGLTISKSTLSRLENGQGSSNAGSYKLSQDVLRQLGEALNCDWLLLQAIAGGNYADELAAMDRGTSASSLLLRLQVSNRSTQIAKLEKILLCDREVSAADDWQATIKQQSVAVESKIFLEDKVNQLALRICELPAIEQLRLLSAIADNVAATLNVERSNDNCHPGCGVETLIALIRNEINLRGISEKEFAKEINLSLTVLNQILSGDLPGKPINKLQTLSRILKDPRTGNPFLQAEKLAEYCGIDLKSPSENKSEEPNHHHVQT